MKRDQLSLLTLFQTFISESRTGKRTSGAGRRLSKGSIQQYHQAYRMLLEYQAYQGEEIFIPLARKNSRQEHRKLQKSWNLLHYQLNRFLYKQKGIYDQYAGSLYKIIRTLCRYLIREKGYLLGEYYLKLKAPEEQYKPVIFGPEQLRFLINDPAFEDQLSRIEKKIKLILVLGCMVGLRFSDLMRLKKENLCREASITYVTITTGKTQTEVRIPLPEKIRDQLAAQKGKTGRYLLPRISNSSFNIQVKKLIEKAGWIEPKPRFKQRQGKPIEQKKNGKSWRFCDHVSAHTMRRTAITCLLMMGLEEAVVRRVSGHAPGSKEFHRYVVLSQTYINKKLIEAQEKLLSGL